MSTEASKSEVSESAFEYLLAEILNICPPQTPTDDHVSAGVSLRTFFIVNELWLIFNDHNF